MAEVVVLGGAAQERVDAFDSCAVGARPDLGDEVAVGQCFTRGEVGEVQAVELGR